MRTDGGTISSWSSEVSWRGELATGLDGPDGPAEVGLAGSDGEAGCEPGGEARVRGDVGALDEACMGCSCTSITGTGSCTGKSQVTPGRSSDNKVKSYLRILGPWIAGSFAGKDTGCKEETLMTTPGVAKGKTVSPKIISREI